MDFQKREDSSASCTVLSDSAPVRADSKNSTALSNRSCFMRTKPIPASAPGLLGEACRASEKRASASGRLFALSAVKPGFSIGVRSDWPELVTILDKLIDTISEAEQREISQKWLSLRYESKIDYRAIWTALAIFIAILLTGGLYIRQLSRQRQALMAARAEAEAANRSKDQLLAVVSHELRTPLTPILAAVGLLARNASLPPEARHLLATIKRNAELEARLAHVKAYAEKAKSLGIEVVLGYVCATSIVGLDDFDANWSDEFRAKFARFDVLQ